MKSIFHCSARWSAGETVSFKSSGLLNSASAVSPSLAFEANRHLDWADVFVGVRTSEWSADGLLSSCSMWWFGWDRFRCLDGLWLSRKNPHRVHRKQRWAWKIYDTDWEKTHSIECVSRECSPISRWSTSPSSNVEGGSSPALERWGRFAALSPKVSTESDE